ncbi:probable E3 ubiquitin-protein ligase HIP1 [Phragmites australis]|uniref:probable E3 ubiquitin-protein ligase HIP1 n=1 Tax=Phragmites australis TaxID=29695 RepID=UPI002D78CC2D|nr:probable E3 ubiquitin-protein ligase HIP1 [Phragmites australis]XP_062225236.1 probable E3 ubiquitin-protein ligase HIP1 [Phragmites australis]
MQHNRIIMLSSSETCHLGSSSNSPAMDQQNLLPNNPTMDEQILLPDTLENESYPHYLLNGHEVGMPNGSLIGQQNTSLSLWESAGSSSMGCLVDHGNFLQAKTEHFAPSLSIGDPLSIDRRRHEANSSLPSHNLNIDLNVNQADQFGIEDVDVVHSNGQLTTNTASLNRSSSITECIQHHEISLDAIGSSSQTVDCFNGAVGQEFGVLDSHRSSYKRKNIDGNHAETSANGGSRNQYQNNNILRPSRATHESTSSTMPSTNYDDSYPPVEQLNQNTDISPSATLSDHYSLYADPHESERFVRNTRMRISSNEYDRSLPRLLPEESFRCSAYQPTQQQSSFIPVQPRAMSSSVSSHSRPHVPSVTQFSQSLHRHPSNGNFGSRIGSSSSSADTATLSSTSQDPSRSLMGSNVPEPLFLGSFFNADSTNLLSAPGSRSNHQNSGSSSSSTLRAAVNVGAQQVPGSNASQPSASVRRSADIARSSLFSAGVSHSRSSSIALQHRGPSSTSQEIRSHQPGSSFRAHQQHYFRAGPSSIDRQNSGYLDLQSFMQTIAASREGSRTVSELRNVVDQIRQGRTARLEDLLLIDRSLIVRRANLIDRHRDMRLDVDNMSYEELLALGERIGYVNTGLSEEKIMKGLKQWKYFCMPLEESATGVEPCCICQENYVDGEDMGRLDCSHDFHTSCIKQWLVIKNVCPICKKTALGT